MLSGKPATIGDFRMVIWKSRVGFLARSDWSLYYPFRKGLTLISGSKKLTPHLHVAKHFVEHSNLRNNSYFTLISSLYNYQYIHFRAGFHLLPSRCHFSIKQYLRVPAQGGGGHFWRLHISMIKSILSFINSGHPSTHPTIQPNLDEFVTGSELCVDCCTVGQVNQGRRLPVKPVQSKECCPENAMAFPMSGQKSSLKGPAANCEAKNDDLLMICSLTSPNSITFEVSKWRWWKSVHPSVLSPCRSSPALNTTS